MEVAIVLLSALLAPITDMAGSALEGSVKFTSILVRYESLMITGATWVLIQTFWKTVPNIANHPILARLKPMMSVILCTGAAFLPSFRLEGQRWDEMLLYGIVLGSSTSYAHKILSQVGFGKDRRINPFVDDPELQAAIDEYLAAKAKGANGGKAKKKLMDHLKHLLT